MIDPSPELPTDPTSATAVELRQVVGKLKRRLREQTDLGGLSWPQVQVMAHMDRQGPMTITALAKAEGMRSQSMGATVAALEAEAFVLGEPHPTDGRQTVWSLTAKAHAWIEAGRAQRSDWLLQAIRHDFSADEQEALAVGIRLLRRLADR